jgi:hypothetical protein
MICIRLLSPCSSLRTLTFLHPKRLSLSGLSLPCQSSNLLSPVNSHSFHITCGAHGFTLQPPSMCRYLRFWYTCQHPEDHHNKFCEDMRTQIYRINYPHYDPNTIPFSNTCQPVDVAAPGICRNCYIKWFLNQNPHATFQGYGHYT